METELKPRAASINDIAAALGIAKVTVSCALNGKGRVAASTRAKILETAEQMGFQPNPLAQGLSTGRRSNTIAICFKLDLGVNARKLQVIQGRLMDQGYEIPAHALNYWVNPQILRQTTEIASMVCRQRPRAIVTTMMPQEALGELRHYQATGGIVVSYDTRMPLDCDQVLFDRKNSTYLATKHLLELGHRNIGYCAPGGGMPGGDYLEGYLSALREFGIEANSEWIFESDIYPYGGVNEEAGVELAARFLELSNRPSAMCITDDYAAMAFAVALEEAGLQVPGDVSLVGCDDAPIARYGKLKLTTVTHPVHTIAEHVVGFVRNRIEDGYDGPAREINLSGELVVRESTAPFV